MFIGGLSWQTTPGNFHNFAFINFFPLFVPHSHAFLKIEKKYIGIEIYQNYFVDTADVI